MSVVRSRKAAIPSPLLSQRDEEILKAVHFYRYMTAVDVTRLLFSPASLAHVRRILSRLSGNADHLTNQYLYRFRLPNTGTGNSERVYTLGSRGRDFLAREVGLPVEWYFRPEKVRHLGFGQLVHNLVLTRFLIAAQDWCKRQPHFRLANTRICYELVYSGVRQSGAGKRAPLRASVIPDAWLLFERVRDNKVDNSYPILLEIDRGTAYQQKFKQHVEARINFIGSGAYKAMFGTDAVLIAYATTGSRPEFRATRVETMRVWTREVLAKLHKERWSSIFRFCVLSLDDMYEVPLFRDPVWHQPDVPEPVALFPT